MERFSNFVIPFFVFFCVLFVPTPVRAAELDIEPYAAKPVPPDGYTEKEVVIVKRNITSPIYTFTVAGQQTFKARFDYSDTSIQSLPLDSIWNKTLYLDYVQYPSLLEDRRTTSSAGTTWTAWSTQYALPVTGGDSTMESLNGAKLTVTINASNLYLSFSSGNRGINFNDSITTKVNPGFKSQKIQFRANEIKVKFIYYEHTGSNTDKIIDAVGDAAQDIKDAISGQTQDINKTINNGVTTIINNNNSNTNKITDGIKQQTTSINNQIGSATNKIINNNNSNTNKITDSIGKQTQDITQNADQNTQKILDQNSQFRDEDRAEAEGIGKIAQDFLDTNTAKVRSNFNILWEPIAFTQRVVSVFSGGTRSAAYADRYNGVVGFKYNSNTGCLDPVLDISPRARYGRSYSGTTITFPSYTLPVLNFKLWDEYTFDLASIKTSFPVLFNAIYVVTGCLCLYWFLGFLSDKFVEVYKE